MTRKSTTSQCHLQPPASKPSLPWIATTDSDARIAHWRGGYDRFVGGDGSIRGNEKGSVWKLTFGAVNTFSPEVMLTFFVKDEEHYQVPLLLRPHSYTGAKLGDQMIWMR